jgi:hypothetical protein
VKQEIGESNEDAWDGHIWWKIRTREADQDVIVGDWVVKGD